MVYQEEIYLNTILDNTPRILGNLNRNKSSVNYGSFDRDYWHYKQNDISCSRKQEYVKVLSSLYINKFKNNIYYKNKKIEDYIFASLDFTCKIQNTDGSFNEWYVNEGSFVATSFLTEAIADTLLTLKIKKIKLKKKYLDLLVRSSNWLIDNFELIVMNQAAGTILALYKVYQLTKNHKYKKFSEIFLDKFIKNQTKEGWWSEYEGPDIGYLSVTLNYLAEYYSLNKKINLLISLKKCSSFIKNFIINPKINIGGSYMSRNTNYIIPTGFLRLMRLDKNCDQIFNYSYRNYQLDNSLVKLSMDDRYSLYFSHFILSCGLFLKNEVKDLKFSKLNIEYNDTYYKDSKIMIIKKKNFSFIANFKKGGCFHFYSKKNTIDNGIFVKYKNDILSTNLISENNQLKIDRDKVQIFGRMCFINEGYFKTFTLVLFKIFQKIFIVNNFIRKKNKEFLRDLVVRQNKKISNIRYSRKFIFNKDSILCEDIIYSLPKNSEIIYGSGGSSFSFVPSSNFFNKNLLELKDEKKNHLIIKKKEKQIKISRVFKF